MSSAGSDWTNKSFWERPRLDRRRIGDRDPAAIWVAVGMALSEWECIEDNLSMLFSVFCADARSHTQHAGMITSHLFGITESSSARMRMIKAAAALYFGYSWEEELVRRPFKQLFEAVSHASHRRNEIAHGRVKRTSVGRSDGSIHDGGTFLTAPGYALNRHQPFFERTWDNEDVLGGTDTSEYRYNAYDIMDFVRKFSLLSRQVVDLVMESAIGDRKMPKMVARLYEQGKIGPGSRPTGQ